MRYLTCYAGLEACEYETIDPQPPIPYGQQTRQNSLTIEDGFKV
jgi:phospholipase C